MDFAFLPPEINSGRMYSGPGSGSLLAAAGSWDSLAAELEITAETYESVVSGLTTLHWRGLSSVAMAASTTLYMGWLHSTAEQTKLTAMQARAAVAAYELAHAMTVPPLAVTANRIQLASLIATNFFGQNTAAIAATEAQYAEYWAQDAAAMYGYAISSAEAAQLTPFSSPHQTTNPAGLTAQNAAVTQANAGAAASDPVSRAVSAAVQSLQAQAANPAIGDVDFSILNGIRAVATSISGTYKMEAISSGIIGADNDLGILPDLGAEPAGAGGAASGLGGSAGLGNVTATVARAGTIGSMSVPTSWATPSNSPVTAPITALSEGGLSSFPGAGEPALSGSGVPGIPGMPGLKVSRPTGVIPRYGVNLTVMSRPPAAG
jgi:PPE-repeat protein